MPHFVGTARAKEVGHAGREFIYHKTAVVTISHCGNHAWLNSDGWRTATTLRAMNQASAESGWGFKVFQRQGQWYVTHKGESHPYQDRMHLSR